MAICRFSRGRCDVYLWPLGDPAHECSGCSLARLPRSNIKTLAELWAAETIKDGELEAHLLAHREIGDLVPDYAIEAARAIDEDHREKLLTP